MIGLMQRMPLGHMNESNMDDVMESLSQFHVQTPIIPSINNFGGLSKDTSKSLQDAKLAFEQYFQAHCNMRQSVFKRLQSRPASCSPTGLIGEKQDQQDNFEEASLFIGKSRQRSPLSAFPVMQTTIDATCSYNSHTFLRESPSVQQESVIIESVVMKRGSVSNTLKKGKIQKAKKSIAVRRVKGLTPIMTVSPTLEHQNATQL
ncbi:hypothetical protein AKO1_006540 [Acrasis kona]|uniref:Uncharacterized protein n=1 Tax=Acrasis kona TaxID=1008807 RepID=A0AAW2ZN84_9EUKA